MTKQADDFEAVRQVVGILEPFQDADRERIIRWAREKLNMGLPAGVAVPAPASRVAQAPVTLSRSGVQDFSPQPASVVTDIKVFIATRNPKNDMQLAATVAYFYRFVAPEAERKDTINATDLLEACRKADRKRPSRATQTMVNAYKAGLLDKAGYGAYRINSVGENLVAMVLPGGEGSLVVNNTARQRVGKGTRRSPSRKTQKAK